MLKSEKEKQRNKKSIDLLSRHDEKKHGDVGTETRKSSIVVNSVSVFGDRRMDIYTKKEKKKNGIIVSAVETRPAGRESRRRKFRLESLATRVYRVSVSRLGHACRVGVERGTRRHARVFSCFRSCS